MLKNYVIYLRNKAINKVNKKIKEKIFYILRVRFKHKYKVYELEFYNYVIIIMIFITVALKTISHTLVSVVQRFIVKTNEARGRRVGGQWTKIGPEVTTKSYSCFIIYIVKRIKTFLTRCFFSTRNSLHQLP